MGLIKAKCTECGSPLQIQEGSKKAKCPHCGNVFLVEDAVNNFIYNTTNNIKADVVNVINQKEDFVIDGCILKKYQGKSEIVVVPDGIKEIGEEAFHESGITKVILPDSVKVIGGFAFEECKYLEEIDLNKVEEIKVCAFRFSGLKRFNGTPTLKCLDNSALEGCDKLEEITFSAPVKLGPWIFGRLGLDKVTVPVDSVGEETFENSYVKEFTITGNNFGFSHLWSNKYYNSKKFIIRTKRISFIDIKENLKDITFVIGKEVEEIGNIYIAYHSNLEVEDVDQFFKALKAGNGYCYATKIYHNGEPITSIDVDEEIDRGSDAGLFMPAKENPSLMPNIMINSTVKQNDCPYCGASYKGLMNKLTHKCEKCGRKYTLKK